VRLLAAAAAALLLAGCSGGSEDAAPTTTTTRASDDPSQTLTAEVAAPATEDRQLAIDAIDYLYPQRGTAIGDGIARGVEVARNAEVGTTGAERPAAILLLSDGSQTEGILQPLEGAARAKSFKIPVYTIALGTPEGVGTASIATTRPTRLPPMRTSAFLVSWSTSRTSAVTS